MIIPLNTKVLLKEIKKEKKLGSLIISSEPDQIQLIIEKIGFECKETLHVGQEVLLEKYVGTKVDDDYMIVDEKHILAVYEK